MNDGAEAVLTMAASSLLTGHWMWHHITRLGEAQILVPAMVALLLILSLKVATRPTAIRWVCCTTAAALITVLSKIAFIGYGLGIESWDFTGFSGHSMFSAAILPGLIGLIWPGRNSRFQVWTLLPGTLLALLIAVSRVQVGAHSWSEAALGALLGLSVTVAVWIVPRQVHRPSLKMMWISGAMAA